MPIHRLNRVAACVLTASALLAAFGPGLAAAIALPPIPPAPGWGPINPMTLGGPEEPGAFLASTDGKMQALVTAERDDVTYAYNLTLRIRGLYGFSENPVLAPIATYTGMNLAATTDTTRAFVFTSLVTPAGPRGVYLSYVTSGGSVGVPFLVSDSPSNMNSYLAATPGGDVMVAWLNYNGSYAITTNHSRSGQGFDGSVPLVRGASGHTMFKLVALGADRFLAVWDEQVNGKQRLFASVFTGGSGWSSPAEIFTPPGALWGVELAASPALGRAVVAFWEGQGYDGNLSLLRFDGVSWSAREIVYAISAQGINAYFPFVALDDAGATHLFWGDGPELSRFVNYTYRRADAAGVWGEAWTHQAIDQSDAQLRVASDGSAAITWTEGDSIGRRFASVARFVPGSGWRDAFTIDEAGSNFHRAQFPLSVLSAGGNYTLAWLNAEYYDGQLVYRDFVAGNTPPALTVSAPTEGQTVETPTVLVQGTTAPGVRVVVDGVVADVAKDGAFSVRVALAPGAHLIEVYGVDEWGNSARARVTVTFVDPLPDLEEQLASAQENTSASQAEVEHLHEATHTLQQQAGAAETRAANLSSDLNETNQVVQHQQSDLDFLRAQAATSANATQAAQSSAGTGMALGVVGLLAGLGGIAMSLMRRPGGGGGGGGGGGELRTSGPSQAQQGAEPAGKGGPEPHEPGPPPRPGAAAPEGAADSTGGIKQTMQQQV